MNHAFRVACIATVVALTACSVAQTTQKRKSARQKPKPGVQKPVKPVPKVNDGRIIYVGCEGDVLFCTFLTKTNQVFAAGADFSYRWWDQGPKLSATRPHDADAGSTCLAPDGKTVAVATMDGDLQVVRMLDGRILTAIASHETAVMSTFWMPDSINVGAVTKDGHVRLFNVDTKEIALDLTDTGADFACAVAGGAQIATINSIGLHFYDAAHGEQKGAFEFVPEEKSNTAGPLLSMPDGKQLLVTFAAPDDDPDKNCDSPMIFDCETRKPTLKFAGVTKAVLSSAVSANGKYVAFGTSKRAYVFEVLTQKQVYTYSTENQVLSLSFALDGKSILMGESGGGLLQVPIFPKPATTPKVGG